MPCCAAGAATVALALLVPPGLGQDAASWCETLGFSLELPDGWRLESDLPLHGLVLRPPGVGAPAVEFVTWRVSVGVRGPEEAAREHEWLLAARMPYRRTRLEAIAVPGAGEGVIVEGLIAAGDAPDLGSLLAVFTRGAQAYAIGLFVDADQLDTARTEYLEPVLQRLTLATWAAEVQPAHAPPPARAVEPLVSTQPAVPTPPPRTDEVTGGPGHVEEGPSVGATPGDGRRDGTGGRMYTDPSGFTVLVPDGWRCDALGGVVRLSSDRGAMLLLAPVTGGAPGRLDAEDLIARCLDPLGRVRLLKSASQPSGDAAPWRRVAVELEGEALDGIFSLPGNEPTGLAAGLVGPPEELGRLLPVAADVVASFGADLHGSAGTPPAGPTTPWVEAGGLLSCRCPAGWVLHGGVNRYDNRPVVALQGQREDGAAWFAWRQPIRPVFRELTEAMRALGFRDGDPYYAYDGVDPRMVLSRASVRELVLRHLLPEGLTSMGADPQVTCEEPLHGLALIGQAREEVELVGLTSAPGVASGGAWFVVATASLGDTRDGWFWEAAGLGVGGAPGQTSSAARALQAAIRSAEATPQADAEAQQALAVLIARSRAALDAPPWRELVGGTGLALPLAAPQPGSEALRCVAPASTVAAWRALASDALGSYNGMGAERH